MIRVGRLRLAVLVLALAGAVQPVTARAQLPSLGEGAEISASAERRIGDRIARELFRDPDFLDDAVLSDYVQSIWQPLLAAARKRGDLAPDLDQRFAWQVLLGRDRSVNAFALPGGWLGLHLGLVATTGTRDELASVMAHELSHVTQRHIARLVTQDKRQAPWMIGAMILGALAASKSPQAGNAVIAGGQAMAMQNQLNFSREMEREADRIGFAIMTQAGFHPQGFTGMFEKLQQASRLNDTGAYPYLRTHPMTTERVADMQSRQVLGDRGAAPRDLEHAMMAARSRTLSAPGVDGLRALQKEAEALAPSADAWRQAHALYATAFASARLRDQPAADAALARLAALALDDPRALRARQLLQSEIALMAGNPRLARERLPSAEGGRAEVFMAAHIALESGQAADALQRLQTWVALHPLDGSAWQLLARAAAAQQQPLRAVRAEAEAQVAWLDYQGAMDRLRAAQAMARQGGGDHIEASIIDTRARQVEALLREQALER